MADFHDEIQEKVILHIGACALDRMLAVSEYPEADAKVRTTSYNETGGGNAGNTATTMALLANSAFLRESEHAVNIKIKLLTKLGDDSVGGKLVQELSSAGVDLSSPLFQVKTDSTSSFTTIVVSETEQTRTCFHTAGTCGELTLEDFARADLDEVFENAVLLNSDGRHTVVANALAREARKRGIPVAVDPERDRHMAAQDELMALATTLFTNSDQMRNYFDRRNRELEAKHGRRPLVVPKVKGSKCSAKITEIVSKSIEPSSFYLRWYAEQQLHKDIVLTKGKHGSVRVLPTQYESMSETASGDSVIFINAESYPLLVRFTDPREGRKYQFQVATSGVARVNKVIDTTGAGDTFIAAYMLCKVFCPNESQLALHFGSWVVGKKLQGPGAQSALPKSFEVDTELGKTVPDVQRSLETLVGSIGH